MKLGWTTSYVSFSFEGPAPLPPPHQVRRRGEIRQGPGNPASGAGLVFPGALKAGTKWLN